MDDHNEMYEIGLTAPMEMAEEYRLDEMLPMMGLKIGKRCIILISNSVNAEEVLDALETLRCAEEMLAAAISEYMEPIYRGIVDYDENYDNAIAELKKAGLDTIIAEYQAQFSEFYHENH